MKPFEAAEEAFLTNTMETMGVVAVICINKVGEDSKFLEHPQTAIQTSAETELLLGLEVDSLNLFFFYLIHIFCKFLSICIYVNLFLFA